MKKIGAVLFAIILIGSLALTAAAAPGGLPAAHGTDGPGFGEAVAEKALETPCELAEHASDREPEEELEAVDEENGKKGLEVSAQAKSNPLELAASAAGKAETEADENDSEEPGMPAKHDVCGFGFSEMVRDLAMTDPLALAFHVSGREVPTL